MPYRRDWTPEMLRRLMELRTVIVPTRADAHAPMQYRDVLRHLQQEFRPSLAGATEAKLRHAFNNNIKPLLDRANFWHLRKFPPNPTQSTSAGEPLGAQHDAQPGHSQSGFGGSHAPATGMDRGSTSQGAGHNLPPLSSTGVLDIVTGKLPELSEARCAAMDALILELGMNAEAGIYTWKYAKEQYLLQFGEDAVQYPKTTLQTHYRQLRTIQ